MEPSHYLLCPFAEGTWNHTSVYETTTLPLSHLLFSNDCHLLLNPSFLTRIILYGLGKVLLKILKSLLSKFLVNQSVEFNQYRATRPLLLYLGLILFGHSTLFTLGSFVSTGTTFWYFCHTFQLVCFRSPLLFRPSLLHPLKVRWEHRRPRKDTKTVKETFTYTVLRTSLSILMESGPK